MEIKPCLFYRVVKDLGRPRPLKHISTLNINQPSFSSKYTYMEETLGEMNKRLFCLLIDRYDHIDEKGR